MGSITILQSNEKGESNPRARTQPCHPGSTIGTRKCTRKSLDGWKAMVNCISTRIRDCKSQWSETWRLEEDDAQEPLDESRAHNIQVSEQQDPTNGVHFLAHNSAGNSRDRERGLLLPIPFSASVTQVLLQHKLLRIAVISAACLAGQRCAVEVDLCLRLTVILGTRL